MNVGDILKADVFAVGDRIDVVGTSKGKGCLLYTSPCTVVQKKTVESDGYVAVQLGYGDISAKKVSKPAKGHFDKADVAPKRTLREFRLDDISAMNVGDILKADVFAVGDRIDVVGTSKGKGCLLYTSPCTVVQKKTVESDGYVAVQLGYGDISAKKVSKPAKGHFDKADVAPKRTLREFRLDDISAMNAVSYTHLDRTCFRQAAPKG